MLGPDRGNGSFQKLNSKRSWFRLESSIFALSFRNSMYSWGKMKKLSTNKRNLKTFSQAQQLNYCKEKAVHLYSEFLYSAMLKTCEPCCFSVSSDSRSGLGSLLCTATDALQPHNSRGHCSTMFEVTLLKRCSTSICCERKHHGLNHTQYVMTATSGRFLPISTLLSDFL